MRKTKSNQCLSNYMLRNEVNALDQKYLNVYKKNEKTKKRVCYKGTDFPEKMFQMTCKVNSIRKSNLTDVSFLVAVTEQEKLTRDILSDVRRLSDLKDLRDQICMCVQIKEQTVKLLKMTKVRGEENYQKACIHLFLQAIGKNYAEHLLTQSQLDLLTEILEESKKDYVSEEKYFQLDEKVYNNDMNIFPEEE